MTIPGELSAEQRQELLEAKAYGEKLLRRLAAAIKKLATDETVRVKVVRRCEALEAKVADSVEDLKSIGELRDRREQLGLLGRSMNNTQGEKAALKKAIADAVSFRLPRIISAAAKPLREALMERITADFGRYYSAPHLARAAAEGTDAVGALASFLSTTR